MSDKVLLLRTCNADMTSYNGFKWPTEGQVICPDWDPKPECSNGLHGLLCGVGDGSLLNWDDDAVWQVIEVEANAVIELNGKVKVPNAIVVYCGQRQGAIDLLVATYPDKAIVARIATAGGRGIATAGDRGGGARG